MKLNLLLIGLLAGFGGKAAGQQSEFAVARAYHADGEFKKAAAHFQLALKTNPNDAESNYWMGLTYRGLADIATPFGGRYNSKARFYLARAVELAPTRSEYRRELFDALVDPSGSSGSALKQAAQMLQTLPKDDPDYDYLLGRLERERSVNPSADARLGTLLLIVPRTVHRIAELPASALSKCRTVCLRTPAQP